jgi:hypothetical protein
VEEWKEHGLSSLRNHIAHGYLAHTALLPFKFAIPACRTSRIPCSVSPASPSSLNAQEDSSSIHTNVNAPSLFKNRLLVIWLNSGISLSEVPVVDYLLSFRTVTYTLPNSDPTSAARSRFIVSQRADGSQFRVSYHLFPLFQLSLDLG